jgi:hypothetical protein
MSITINGTTGITNASGGTVLDTTSDLGWGQTWQDVLASRAVSTSYQNLTSRPIQVAICTNGSTTKRPIQVSVDNTTWIQVGTDSGGEANTSFIVPINWYYRINGSTSLIAWAELR